LVVEDEVTLHRAGREHCVALALFIAHYGHQERARRPATSDEELALQERVIFAVAARGRDGPVFGDAIDLHVGGRSDLVVDQPVYGIELAQALRRGREALLLRRTLTALFRHPLAELDEAIRGLRHAEHAHVRRASVLFPR